VPSTLLGLVVFVVSLAPGLTFVLLRERRMPERSLSTFRETAVVVCVSLATDTIVLVLFALARAAAPELTPDIGYLVRAPTEYFRSAYQLIFWWSLVLLALAIAFASWVGSGAARRALARLPRVGPPAQASPHESGVSAWWLVFHEHPETTVYVGCVLDDGSFVSGWLHSYSTAAADLPDRDLSLSDPIRYRASGSTISSVLDGVGAVVINAHRIVLLSVSYVQPAQGANDLSQTS
jgi:hypothetical protein